MSVSSYVDIGGIRVGPEYPPMIVAELGINHIGDLACALDMVRLAGLSGATAVKFQKRKPKQSVPNSEKSKRRETPWGIMTYLDYKERMEFWDTEYEVIAKECLANNLLWFASVWDVSSVDFIDKYDPPVYKIGSATLTNFPVLERVLVKHRPIIMSTGMSTMQEIEDAVTFVREAHDRLILCHSTSIYPCPKSKVNLMFLNTLAKKWPHLVLGYSGHEEGIGITQAAVALNASYIERHFTLDNTMWGTDQAASLEHLEFAEMAAQCHAVWYAKGDGKKVVYPEELEKMQSLRPEVILAAHTS